MKKIFYLFRFKLSHFVGILFIFILCGCVTTEYNLATKREETLLYDTEKEVKIGTAYAAKINKTYKMNTDVDVNERINDILNRIVEVCDRKDLVYFIKIIDKKSINAVSFPGGYIYLFQGLIDQVESDDELAGVIAHEVAHITAKHGIKRLQAAYGSMLLQVTSSVLTPEIAQGTNLALTSLFFEHSQQDEFLSDRLAVKYMKKAGYDPNGMISFFLKLKKENEKAPLKNFSYWKTHPYPAKRMAVVNQEITGKLGFRDYINLTEDKGF